MKRNTWLRQRVSSCFRSFRQPPSEATATSIYKAAKSGDAAKLEELLLLALDLPERENLINAEDSKGKTPLVMAVSRGHIACVIKLLTHGADVHHMGWTPKGGTALHEAVQAWIPKNVISLLLQNGANPFVENVAKLTPWDMAVRRGDASLFRSFEHAGRFREYLLCKVPTPKTNGTHWERRWISVIPRFAGSRASREQQYLSTWLLVFEDRDYSEPYFQVKIDHAEVMMRHDDDMGMEVVLTPISSDVTTQLSKYLVHQTGRGRIFLSGSDKALVTLVKAIKGERDAVSILADRPHSAIRSAVPKRLFRTAIAGTSYEEDLELAKRLQDELDRDLLQQEARLAAQASSSNGAGPSTSGSGYVDEHCQSPEMENAIKNEIAAAAAEGSSSSSQQPQDKHTENGRADLCIVCLDAPTSAGFAHGNSVHWCVCKKCARHLWESGNCCCPLCRMSVDNIITDFYAN